jgi:hypothetical protein
MRRVLVGLALLSAAILAPAVAAEAGIQANTIGASAALIGHGHVARGTVIIGCTAGERVQFTLTLTQGGVNGTGHGAGLCTGEPTAYEVTVPARGHAFTAACATAVNQDPGVVVDTRRWCRAAGVTLSASSTPLGGPRGVGLSPRSADGGPRGGGHE